MEKMEAWENSLITYTYSYAETLAKDLESITIDDTIAIRPKTDLLGRYVGKTVTLHGGTDAILKEKITYRKVGDHATNQVSCMSFKDGTFYNYTYDEMGNITAVCENGELVARYTYDDLCRLVREDNKILDKTVIFVYDNNGNILTKREYTYTLMSQERLASEMAPEDVYLYVYDGDRLVSMGGLSCVYDQLGCPTTYLGKSVTWDAHGKIINYNNGQAIYTYDSHGRRSTKKVNNNTTRYFYNREGRLICQQEKTGSSMFFLYDHTGVMGMIFKGNTYFYRKNAQGDIIAIEAGANQPVVNYVYDAWGNHKMVDANGDEINASSPYYEIAQANPFRYRSYYFDTETGFYYLPARYYDPAIGRFISQDDYSYLDPETINGLNLYAYCLNNPVMYSDPNGHFAITLTAILIGMVTGAAIGFGASAYMDYADDGQIFNGSTGWKEYLGGTLLGTGVGGLAVFAGAALSAFGGMSFALGSTMTAAGELAAVSGAEVLVATAVLGIYLLSKIPMHGEPNSTITSGGSIGQYDENGNLFSRQDTTGKPHYIKELQDYYLPHTHRWEWKFIEDAWRIVKKFVLPY